jgi:tetratricopeptide (TPR) repeat protein
METLEIPVNFSVEAEKLLWDGNVAAALSLGEKGVSMFSDYPMGWRILAEIYFELNDLAASRKALAQGLSKFPKYQPLIEFEKIIEETEIIEEITKDFKNKEMLPVHEESKSPINATSPKKESEKAKKITGTETADNPSAQIIQERTSFLRLVNNFETHDNKKNQLRADNLGLIPGLSFAPLRATRKTDANDFRSQSPHFPEMYNPVEEVPNEEYGMQEDE